MDSPQLADRTRRRIDDLLADDRPERKLLIESLREVRASDSVPAFALLLHRLAHVRLAEEEAEKLLGEVLDHRGWLADKLGRDPGVRVAAIDLLSNVHSLLRQPTIIELAQLEKTRRSAIEDDLTGMYNRRYGQQALELEVRRSRRDGSPLALLMLDLDGFKPINDRHGHPFGDRVLRCVGELIRRSIRESDLACRIGGEEFLLIFPETDRLGCYVVSERLRLRIESTFADVWDGRQLQLTVSGGIASHPVDGDTAAALVRRADQALYRSKLQGRNRITLHYADRRRAVRYPANPRCRFRAVGGDGAPLCDVRVLALSRYGALLEFSGAAPPSPVRLEIQRGGQGQDVEPLSASGEVVRVESGPGEGDSRAAVAFDPPVDERAVRNHVTLSRRLPSQRSSAGINA